MMPKLLGAIVSLALIGTGSQAGASPFSVQDVASIVILHSANQSSSQSGASVNLSLPNGGAYATGATSLGWPPSMSAEASVTNEAANASVLVTMEYYFEFFNSPSPMTVSISASGQVTKSVVSTGNSAQLFFGTSQGDTTIASACTNFFPASCGSQSSSFSISTNETLTSDTLYNISMTLFVAADTLVSGGGTDIQSGSIDPIITIDPAYLLANPQVQLVFSSGIINAPAATPLPAALPLFASGLGVMGFLAKRRKRKVATTTAAV
jgi:predicted extracellular nuclease